MKKGLVFGVISGFQGTKLMPSSIVVEMVTIKKVSVDLEVRLFTRREIRTEPGLSGSWGCKFGLCPESKFSIHSQMITENGTCMAEDGPTAK